MKNKRWLDSSLAVYYLLFAVYINVCVFFFTSTPCEPLFGFNYRNGHTDELINECIAYEEVISFTIPEENLKMRNIFSLHSTYFKDLSKSSVTYYILKNVYLGSNYQILYNGTFMTFFGDFEDEIYSPCPLRTYKEAICLSHYHTYYYGTLFHDVFPAFLIFPKDLIESLPIIISHWYPQTIEFMRMIGIKTKNIINLTNPEYIFVEKLHTLHDIEYNLIGTPFINVTKIFQIQYNLNNYSATKYVAFNRPKDKLRHALNFINLANYLIFTYPDIPWEIIEGHVEGLKAAAIFWSQIKFVFSIAGSGLTSGQPFMKENSVIVCVMLDWPDPFIYYQAISCKLILIMWRQRKYIHFRAQNISISIQNASVAIDLGVMLSRDPNITKAQRFIEDNNFLRI